MREAIVFLGGGRITGALAAGLRLAGYERPIVVYDRHPDKLRALRRESRVEVAPDLKSAIERAAMLMMAVQPRFVAELFREAADSGARLPRLCVSLAAGIPLRKLRVMTGPSTNWVRAMPSPVCRIGRGLTALCFEKRCTRRDRKLVQTMFGVVGDVMEIGEKAFDAFTAAYSSSHGYHALVTLAQAAQDAGLDRKSALLSAAHALGDGVAYWRESGVSLDALLHEAATPGGIAAATMAAMDASGYARAVQRGLRAGIERARRNAKL